MVDIDSGGSISAALGRAFTTQERLFEWLPVGIYVCDRDGLLLQYNRRAAELWGRSPRLDEQECRFCGALKAYRRNGELLPLHETPMAEVLSTGKSVRGREVVIERPDGSRIAILANLEPLRDDEGQIIGAVNCFQDISQHQRTEARAAERERWYRDLLEALPAAIYTTDAEGRITFYNGAAVELSGRKPEIGSDQWCVTWKLYQPDGSPMRHEECPMAVALRENRLVRGAEALAERPDGTRVPLMPFPTPLRDEQGERIGAVNMLVDISERKQAEEALRRSEANLADFFENATVAMHWVGPDGIILRANRTELEMLGYSRDEYVGQHIAKFHVRRQVIADVLRRLAAGETIEDYEAELRCKDGSVRTVLLSSNVLWEGQRFVHARCFTRDITERKKAEETQRLLMDELHHRVKNTLATVQSIATQTFRREGRPDAMVAAFTGRLHALSKAHALLTEARWNGAALRTLVEEQILLANADHRIVCSGPAVTLEPQIALHLGLVLHELGTNARKHGSLSVPQGRLSVTWSVESNAGHVLHLRWVETNGPPASAPFAAGFGTVLIEESLKGHECDTRRRIDKDGLIWEFTMPLKDRLIAGARFPAVGACSTSRLSPAVVQAAGNKVLVVEDEPLIAMDIDATLSAAGITVVGPARTIAEARQLLEQHDLHAALLDVNVGGEPIDDVAGTLARNNVPFAFLTGYGRESLPAAHRQAQMLKKPFVAETILAAVGGLLADRGEAQVITLRR